MEDCDEEEDDAAMRTPRGADKRKDCERAGSSPLQKKKIMALETTIVSRLWRFPSYMAAACTLHRKPREHHTLIL
jgi:hypothetical protein